jgi:hypothetical protein
MWLALMLGFPMGHDGTTIPQNEYPIYPLSSAYALGVAYNSLEKSAASTAQRSWGSLAKLSLEVSPLPRWEGGSQSL